LKKAKKYGALASYLSGAGSTLMAMVKKEQSEQFQKDMSAYLKTLPDHWQLTLLKADLEGAKVETK